MNIGDKVILVTKRHGDTQSNPVWCGLFGQRTGIVTNVSHFSKDRNNNILTVKVQWPEEETNSYTEDDLEIVPSHKQSLLENEIANVVRMLRSK